MNEGNSMVDTWQQCKPDSEVYDPACPWCQGAGDIEVRNSDGDVDIQQCNECRGTGKRGDE